MRFKTQNLPSKIGRISIYFCHSIILGGGKRQTETGKKEKKKNEKERITNL